MRAAKQTPASDDDDAYFVQEYDNMVKRCKQGRASKRAKVTKSHGSKHDELQKRIASLGRGAHVDGRGTDEASSPGEQPWAGLGPLRDLLDRKTDIERRIAACLQTLETAMNTTSREVQLILRNRAEAASDTSPREP